MSGSSKTLHDGFRTSAVKEVVRVRRELRKRLKDAMRLERELKQAQIEHAYMQHWVMLT